VVEIVGAPPTDFRLARLEEMPPPAPPRPTIWILRRSTDSLLEDLRAMNQSFVALDGAVRVQAPGLLIDRSDLEPAPERGAATGRSAFSDRASHVPRFLFDHPLESSWSITALAAGAGVSPSVASYAARDLEQRGVVTVRREGRERRARLVGHRQLVTEWARHYTWQDNVRVPVLAPIGSITSFLRRLTSLPLPRCALTLHAGTIRRLPHAPVEDIALYVDVRSRIEALQIARECGWTPNPAGHLSLMVPHYRTSVWTGLRETESGPPVVSDLQLILDLWEHPIRGREQAELILEKHEIELW
jgi:DNA-binding transcriptional ArsR family regulator